MAISSNQEELAFYMPIIWRLYCLFIVVSNFFVVFDCQNQDFQDFRMSSGQRSAVSGQ